MLIPCNFYKKVTDFFSKFRPFYEPSYIINIKKNQHMIKRVAAIVATSFLFSTYSFSQGNPQQGQTPGSGGGQFGNRANANVGIKPYSEVITSKAKTNRGLFTTHRVDDKYYFEIPDSVFNRDVLVVNRISKAPAGARAGFLGYAGDQIGENVINFEKGPNNKIFLRSISYQEVGRDSAGMYQSVRNSNLQPITAAFDIRAINNDSISHTKSWVIDVTDYLMGDNDVLFFDSRIKRALGLNQYQKENSYVLDVKSFPNNVEIQTVKSYMRTPVSAPGQTQQIFMVARYSYYF